MGELPSLNRPRAAGAAAVVGDRIVVVGGQADGRLVDTTEVFDGKRWRVGANIPTPREHLAAVSDGHFVYAVGGRALSPDKNSAALERYDPATDKWQRLPDMPTARGGLGAAIADGHLLAVGGETPDGRHGRSRVLQPRDARRGPPRRPCALPAMESPWPRSAARSMRSAAHRKPGHASATRPPRSSGSLAEALYMSQSDIEDLRARYEAVSARRPRCHLSRRSAGLHTQDAGSSSPNAGTYLGAEEAGRFMRDFWEPFEEVIIQPQEFFESGDQIVAILLVRTRYKGSSAFLELRVGALWTMRDGKPIRCRDVPKREEALEAAGLQRE